MEAAPLAQQKISCIKYSVARRFECIRLLPRSPLERAVPISQGGGALSSWCSDKSSIHLFEMEKHDREEEDCAVRLQPATLEDEPFLKQLFASTRADELSLIAGDESQKEMLTNMQFNGQRQQYAMTYPHADHSVILVNEGRVGRMIVASSETAISLVDIALLPEYRNAGIGSGLIQDLLNKAVTAGKTVRLSVFATSPAVHLYERLGFSRVGGDAVYLEMKWVPSVLDPAE